MIYLLRSYGISGKSKSFFKIGFTDNIYNRSSQYFYMNPGCEIVSVREGDYILEGLFHYYLKFLGLQYKKNGKLNEWFINDPRVYQVFHISQESLERKIWKHREKVFDRSKISKSNKITEDYKLFEYLWEKNKENFEGERIIIKEGKLVQTKAKEIDVAFWKSWGKQNKDKLLEENFNDFLYLSNDINIVQDFLDNRFYSTGLFTEKMRMYCEFMDMYKGNREIEDIIYFKIKDERFRKYYNFYGTKGCSARNYQEGNLEESMIDCSKEDELRKAIYNFFRLGQGYTLKEIKEKLGIIYRNLGITSKTPKATDLKKYFKLTRVKFTNSVTKKRIEGYKLESL